MHEQLAEWSSLLVLLVSVLVGGLAIHVGARFGLRRSDFGSAVVTAVLGGLAWAVVETVARAVHLPGNLGALVGLVVWIWVIRWRYDVGWLRGAAIGVGAWLAAVVALAVLEAFGVHGLGAYGVPGA